MGAGTDSGAYRPPSEAGAGVIVPTQNAPAATLRTLDLQA